MLGERPNNAEFEKLFDWPDSLIHLPYDSPDTDRTMNALDKESARQDVMRRMNVKQCLLRHDWVYRWEAILETVGLEPMPQLSQRKMLLRDQSELVEHDEARPTSGPLRANATSSGTDYGDDWFRLQAASTDVSNIPGVKSKHAQRACT
jgi:hypothetical protein